LWNLSFFFSHILFLLSSLHIYVVLRVFYFFPFRSGHPNCSCLDSTSAITNPFYIFSRVPLMEDRPIARSLLTLGKPSTKVMRHASVSRVGF
jgi:hypothetical protein